MRSLRRRAGELLAVLISSLVIGSGIGFLQSLSVFGFRGLSLAAADAGSVGAFVAVMTGGFVYYRFLRDRLTTGLAAKVITTSLAVGVSTGYFLSWASTLITPFATVLASLFWADGEAVKRPLSAPGERHRDTQDKKATILFSSAVKAMSVAVCSFILSLGICVWLFVCELRSLDDTSQAFVGCLSGGCLLGLILYYWLLREGNQVRAVGISISICWAVAVMLSCLLKVGGWATPSATAAVAVLATWWLVKKTKRTTSESDT